MKSVDISSAGFKADPFPFYARLRAGSPVHPVTLPDGRTAWLVTRYDDVAAVLKAARLARAPLTRLSPEQPARQPWMPGFFRPLTRNMLDVDPPDHTRLRGLVHKAFTPRLIERMRGRVQALCDRLLDRAQGRGRLDLIRAYAQPVPTTIIAPMLGVPVADRPRLQARARAP